jgi:hypothetical protein
VTDLVAEFTQPKPAVEKAARDGEVASSLVGGASRASRSSAARRQGRYIDDIAVAGVWYAASCAARIPCRDPHD